MRTRNLVVGRRLLLLLLDSQTKEYIEEEKKKEDRPDRQERPAAGNAVAPATIFRRRTLFPIHLLA